MQKFVFLLLISLTLYCCNTNQGNRTNPIDLIPENADLVLKIESLEAFKSDLRNNTFMKELSGTNLHRDLFRPFEILDVLNTNSGILICFEKNDDRTDYTILTRHHDSLLNQMGQDSLQIYSKLVDSIYVASTSEIILDRIEPNDNSVFKSVFQTTVNTSSFSMFLNGSSANRLGKAIIWDELNELSDFVTMDMEIAPDQIAYSGVAISKDTLPQLIKVFKQTLPQENTIQSIAPSDSEGFLSLSYDDFDVLHRNLNEYRRTTIDSTANYDLFHTINEAGEIYSEDSSIIVLRSIDAFATREALQDHQNPVSNYRNVTLYEFKEPSLFRSVFFH